MRPKERRDGGQRDLFQARLDQILDMSHPLTKLGKTIDWGFLEQPFGSVYAEVPGRLGFAAGHFLILRSTGTR